MPAPEEIEDSKRLERLALEEIARIVRRWRRNGGQKVSDEMAEIEAQIDCLEANGLIRKD